MGVSFGLFNLIMAIYLEQTLSAAKDTDEKHKHRRERESLRVAHKTRQLVVKFCSAQRIFQEIASAESSCDEKEGSGREKKRGAMSLMQEITEIQAASRRGNESSYADDYVDDLQMTVQRELFHMVLQDP